MTGDDETIALEPELERRLRRGLELLADQATPRRPRSQRLALPAAAAALLIAGIGVSIALSQNGRGPAQPQAGHSTSPAQATPASTGGPAVIGNGVSYDLARLVEESPRIVVGTVASVTHGTASGASGGLPYVLAEITIDRTLRGPDSATVVAFDYEYGAGLSVTPAMGASFAVGERVLVFLSSAAGTVHESITPTHWQVTAGASGTYVMRGEEPAAPFTLEQVEQQLRS